MNTLSRRAVLMSTVALGLYVGVWAQLFPTEFYGSFPGFGLHWIDVDGAYNEHLIRDVGSFYLALSVASLVGVFHRSALPGRIAGVAWAVFGVLHYGYHLVHLQGSGVDIIGNVVSLGVSAALGIILTLPSHDSGALRKDATGWNPDRPRNRHRHGASATPPRSPSGSG